MIVVVTGARASIFIKRGISIMRKSMIIAITCILLLALLVVPMTAFANTETSEEPTGVALNAVDEWKFADNYYQGDWTTGKINTTNSQLLKADDTNDMISWVSPSSIGGDAAVSLVDGVLTFSGSSIWSFKTKLDPMTMSENKLTSGPALVGFDVYMGDQTNQSGYFFFKVGETSIFNINLKYGMIAQGGSGAYRDIDIEKSWGRSAGWYTFELLFVPLTEDDIICTSDEQTVAKTKLYFRYKAASDTIPAAPSAISPEELSKWFSYDLGSVKAPYSTLGATSTLGFQDGSKTGTCQIRRAKSSNIIPLSLMVADFAGFDALTEKVTSGTVITIPDATGVVAWENNGTYYFAGDQYTVTADTTFTPLTSTVWNEAIGFDSASQWANASTINTTTGQYGYALHAGEGYTGVLNWYYLNDNVDYSYDDAEKAITIIEKYTTTAGSNTIDWFMDRTLSPGSEKIVNYSDVKNLIYSFDVKYTPGAFDGTHGEMNWTGKIIFKASTTGVVTVGTETVGNLVEGWNNIKLYFISNEAENGYNIYCTLNSTDTAGFILPSTYLSLPSTTWTGTAKGTRLRLHVTTAATSENQTSVTFRNFRSSSLAATAVNYVSFGDKADMMYVPLNNYITLPEAEGVQFWNDGTKAWGCGAQYMPSKSFTAMTPVTAVDLAYEELVKATDTANSAEETKNILNAYRDLVAKMANEHLDHTDSRYTAAESAKATALAALEQAILDGIAAIDPENTTGRFNALKEAIKVYVVIKADAQTSTVEALQGAIDAYNTYADTVNADIVEAATAATSISIFKVPANTDMVAILADIKSKVEGEEE